MHPSRSIALLLCTAITMLSCNRKPTPAAPPLFELQQNTGVDFTNTVTDNQQENILLDRNFYNGGGVAIGDINNDGLPDILLTSNLGQSKLYLNKGNFHFQDITIKAGFHQDGLWNTGVTFVDIDGDGWLDIYICSAGHMTTGRRKNQLYINHHDNTFTEEAARYGLDITGYSTQAVFFDYDGDGDLDCFLTNNSPLPIDKLNDAGKRDLPDVQWPVPAYLKGGGDHLYRNDNGHFTEVTREAGIHGTLMSFGLGASVGDLDGDGYPDIYVSNDSYERDYLYINQHNGTFKDELETHMAHISASSMGADLADINNDGALDLFTTDMLPGDDPGLKTFGEFDDIALYNSRLQAGLYRQYRKNCLQLNRHDGEFFDIADYSGVSATSWSWGALLFDMDNDGYNDIFVCNGVNRDVTNKDFKTFLGEDMQRMISTGQKDDIASILQHVAPGPMLHKAYQNLGNLRFDDVGQSWGFTQPSAANGAAYGDLDNDGDLDLVINNENSPASIYKNDARELNHNHYIAVNLKAPAPNTFAIGSKITVYEHDQQFYRELIPSRGFQSSVDYKTIIGLGKLTAVDSLTITWPDRTMTTFLRPAIDTTYTILKETAARRVPPTPPKSIKSEPTLLEPVAANFTKHEENYNDDFFYESNIPKMFSLDGPRMATGDLDGDGLPDVYIGGTTGHPGQIYMQGPAGSFTRRSQPAFDAFIDFEDEAVLLFDADHDGDLDLLLCPGGNTHPPDSREMQYRLFKNDGKGNFTLDPSAFPMNKNGMSTGVAIAGDFNGDGCMDLFIGGRSSPGAYGISPHSFLFLNDGKGHFSDIAETKNPDIATIGMVTCAAWTDVLGEGRPQLIIAGEWMSPHIFSWKTDHFEATPTNLDRLSGWWQSIAATDLNNDGRTDLVLGNIGENFYLHPDSANPVKLYTGDFDANGTPDNILTHTVHGKDMPIFSKAEMERELPSLKKQNWTNADYAQKSISDLLSTETLDHSQKKLFNYPSSIVAINEGNGKFSIRKLPVMTQLSSINAIRPIDIDGDGFPDLVMGGNDFGFQPRFGRLDASYAQILLNNGHGSFSWIDPRHSGLKLSGEIRDISVIRSNEIYLLFVRNNDYPALYVVKTPAKK